MEASTSSWGLESSSYPSFLDNPLSHSHNHHHSPTQPHHSLQHTPNELDHHPLYNPMGVTHHGYTEEVEDDELGEADYSPFPDELDHNQQAIKPEHTTSPLGHHSHHLNGHAGLSVDPLAYGLGSLDPGPSQLGLDHNHDHNPLGLDHEEPDRPRADDEEWDTYRDRIKYEDAYGAYAGEPASPEMGPYDDALAGAELPAGAGEDEHEPLYVNAKQYHRIMKRRMARARLEEMGRLSRQRKVSQLKCSSQPCCGVG